VPGQRVKKRPIEQITGTVFVAIHIARLAGVYPLRENYSDDGAP